MLQILSFACGLLLAASANAQAVSLGSAVDFGVVAATTITSSGQTVVNGELGLSPGSSIEGFPPGLSGTVHINDAEAVAAQADIQKAYNQTVALPFTTDLSDTDLGGKTLTAGVYHFETTSTLNGILTLDGGGSSSSVFVFQIGTTFLAATAAQVILTNGAQACNVFFQVGSSATLEAGTIFAGNILAFTSISLNTGVSVQGGLYALNGAVTLLDNSVTAQNTCAPVTSSSITSSSLTSSSLTSSSLKSSSPSTGSLSTSSSTTGTTPISTSTTPTRTTSSTASTMQTSTIRSTGISTIIT
ncbi:hypothetical protein MMC16_002210 [Acarospora aff. strigata]|nr:hypothetical protein [Acarospora aff. strigata]